MFRGRTILRVGLTGNIGSGKSTVGRVLADAGCLVIDADELAARVLATGSVALLEVASQLGEDLLDDKGRLDRDALAARIFRDPEARRKLEEITHPRIRQLEEREVASWRVDEGIAVTEAALLVETGGASRYHRLVVVTAPEEIRIRRLVERGMAAEDARRRSAAQMAETEKAAHADYVVDNGGSLERTRKQAERLGRRLRGDLAALTAGATLPDPSL